MNLAALNQQLARVRSSLDAGDPVPNVSVRELLRWAGAERRGTNVVYAIRQTLREHGVDTLPNFNFPDLDRQLQFILAAELFEAEVDVVVGDAQLVAAGNVVMEVIGEARADDPDAAVGVAEAAAQQQQFVAGEWPSPPFGLVDYWLQVRLQAMLHRIAP